MGEDEVLAARLADDARVRLVLGDVLTNGLPEVAEDSGAAREVQAGEIGVVEDHIASHRTIDGHQVDDAFRQARFVQQFHDDMCGVDLLIGGLPHDHVAHQRSRNRQVAGDGREVEWRDGKHEAFECAVFEAVPNARCAFRLLGIDFLGEVAVEPQEVDELTSGIDFGLVKVLSLSEHGGRIDARAPRAGEHFGGAEEDAGALLPVECGPPGARLECGVDGFPNVVSRAEVRVADDPLVVVRRGQGAAVVGGDVASSDHHGHGHRVLVQHALIFGELGFALRAARAVGQDRFVLRVRDLEECVGHGESFWAQR